MIKTRPLRPLNTQALALDAPLPIVPTCAGMRLSWPSGQQEAPEPDVFASDDFSKWPTLSQLTDSRRDGQNA